MTFCEINNINQRDAIIPDAEIIKTPALFTGDGYEIIISAEDEYILPYRYEEESKGVNLSAGNHNVKIFEGEYALYSDKKDKICIKVYEERPFGSITINNTEDRVAVENVQKVSVIDSDSNDSYKEIILHCLDENEQPKFIVFVYNGEEIKNLGTFSKEGHRIQISV
jgi:hypothetical protein